MTDPTTLRAERAERDAAIATAAVAERERAAMAATLTAAQALATRLHLERERLRAEIEEWKRAHGEATQTACNFVDATHEAWAERDRVRVRLRAWKALSRSTRRALADVTDAPGWTRITSDPASWPPHGRNVLFACRSRFLADDVWIRNGHVFTSSLGATWHSDKSDNLRDAPLAWQPLPAPHAPDDAPGAA